MKKDEVPIIVRRKKGGHGGQHGGAWKIALADFMTAMMALFLVLWVISSATPKQLKGIAQYFRTPLAEAMAGGDRDTASNSVIPGGGPDPVYKEGERTNVHIRSQSHRLPERKNLRRLRGRIIHSIESVKSLRKVKDQLHFIMQKDGMLIQITDNEKRPMFKLGSDILAPYMKKILKTIAPLLNELPNKIKIYGHTDSHEYLTGNRGYSNWELSTARANASRRALVRFGLDSGKLAAVTGYADTRPIPNLDSMNPTNRRIEILVVAPDKKQKTKLAASATPINIWDPKTQQSVIPTNGGTADDGVGTDGKNNVTEKENQIGHH